MNIENFLDYPGLYKFFEKLKRFFIKNSPGAAGLFLMLDRNGKAVWSNLPSMLNYRGSVATYSALSSIENPIKGDTYKVEDTGAEYYWDSTSWEYLGLLVNVPTYTGGNHISIDENYVISDSGLQDLLSAGNNIELTDDKNDNHLISAMGYLWDESNKSFAEGGGSYGTNEANGKYSHAEGRNTRASEQAAHSEGLYTEAYGKASHSEGFGIMCNTNSNGFSWDYDSNYDSDIKLTISSSHRTNLTLAKEFYFLSNYSFERYIYSRQTKDITSFAVNKVQVTADVTGDFDPLNPYSDTSISSVDIYIVVGDTDAFGSGDILDFIVRTYAEGQAAHAEGKNTHASGKNSHSEGLLNKTEGENSHVEGHMTYISYDGYNAHAEGFNTRALNNQAHAEGANSVANGENSHVEGESTFAFGKDSHAEGKSSNSPALYDDTFFDDTINNVYSAWAANQTLSGGNYSCAWGNVSHVEGKDNLAAGNNSHAEGQATCAYGDKSHAEGYGTYAKGNNSHAEGDSTIANCMGEHAEGMYNVSHCGGPVYANTDSRNTRHSIGIGTDSARKNAVEVMQNGDMYLYGAGNYNGTTIKASGNNVKTVLDLLGSIPSVPANIVNTIDSKTGDFTVDSGNNSGSWNVNFTVDNNNKISGTVDHPTIPTVPTNVSAFTNDAGYTTNTGTVTSVSAGVGLTTSDGNAITSSGTIKAKLRSESLVNLTSVLGNTPNRQYAVELDTDGYLSVNIPWTDNNDNTTYSFSLSGNTLTITPSDGSTPDTYTPTIPSVGLQDLILSVDGDTISIATPTDVSNSVYKASPIGSISMYAGETAPDGWLLCQGLVIGMTQGNSTIAGIYLIGLKDLCEKIFYDFYYDHSLRIGKITNSAFLYAATYSGTDGSEVTVLTWTDDITLAAIFSSGTTSLDGNVGKVICVPDLRLRLPIGAASGTIGKNGHTTSSSGWSTSLGKSGGEDTNTLDVSEIPSHNHSLVVYETSGTGERNPEQTTGNTTSYTSNHGTGTAGGGDTHNNMPPFLAVNFIIKY